MATTSKRQRRSEDVREGTEKEESTDSPSWFLFPAPGAPSFGVGDSVVIKPGSAKDTPSVGTIKEVAKKAGGSNSVKYSIEILREPSESSSGVPALLLPRKRLMKMIGSSASSSGSHSAQDATIIVTSETCHYRQLANLVSSSDRVLEIGCSTGATSRYLIRYAQAWTGLDTSDEMLEKCEEFCNIMKVVDEKSPDAGDRYEFDGAKVHLAKVDALRDPQSALKAIDIASPNPTMVFIDIGGNREIINVQRMVQWVMKEYAASIHRIVIKSRELAARIRDANEISADGRIHGTVDMTATRLLPKHPQRAPMSMSPVDGVTPICRYHNYHTDGCAKGDKCPLDHLHCHACFSRNHVGRNCPEFSR